MSDDKTPHPDNVPGPFLVVHGCCTACGVPEDSAPELFAWDGHSHCYVKRQPRTPEETEKALLAIRRAELNCIRYRGADPEVLERFAGLGQLTLCDAPEARRVEPTLRGHVTFDFAEDVGWSHQRLAGLFSEYPRALKGRHNYRVTAVVDAGDHSSLNVAWFSCGLRRAKGVIERRVARLARRLHPWDCQS